MKSLEFPLNIRMNKGDIDRGIRCSRSGCPVARAIRRRIGGKYVISVSSTEISFWIEGLMRVGFVPPPNVATFIKRFDEGKEVKPMNFSVEKTRIIPKEN